MEEEVKELEKVMVKLRAQADIREAAIKNEEPAREASRYELSEVRASSLLVVCLFILADNISPSSRLYWRRKGANRCHHGRGRPPDTPHRYTWARLWAPVHDWSRRLPRKDRPA